MGSLPSLVNLAGVNRIKKANSQKKTLLIPVVKKNSLKNVEAENLSLKNKIVKNRMNLIISTAKKDQKNPQIKKSLRIAVADRLNQKNQTLM